MQLLWQHVLPWVCVDCLHKPVMTGELLDAGLTSFMRYTALPGCADSGYSCV